MKTLTLIAAAALVAQSASAQGNIAAPVTQRRALPPLSPAQSEGGLQRGVRLGNPAQMLNPIARAEYGSGRDFLSPKDVSTTESRKGHVRPESAGVRLISFSF